MKRLPGRKWLIPLTLAVAIKLFSLFPQAVEKYYSHGFYPVISKTLRFLLGWIPFSIGDILYIFAGLWLISAGWKFFRLLFRKQMNRAKWKMIVGRTMYGALMIYIIFNLSWGLNYNRVPMMRSLDLDASPYTTEELRKVTDLLVLKSNEYDSLSVLDRPGLGRKSYLFGQAKSTYEVAAAADTRLKYVPASVKPSLFSYAGNYLGFTGYYNPFSGEAQTNTTVPRFIQPFTTCHEIGHQLGYAKENEANFAGFLSARLSTNPSFKYSVYFDMLSYALREMQIRDSLQATEIRSHLNPQVRADFVALRQFYRKYDNLIEPVIRILYSNYLRANDQPQGMKTYNQVVAMMVAYYRRYGTV